ncbi:S41 family peptidase [Pontimicrobium sp. SW4]|uniref:S41 family peptidase n=1 Tax=Pontimicrobium sp. SW4 TaxID=3153519 RepID=A0AAU7BW83_9FLAO
MVKENLRQALLFVITLFISTNLIAQKKTQEEVNQQELNVLIDSISQLVKKYYITLEDGNKMSELLLSKNKNKEYNNLIKPYELATQLTTDLQSINGDLHMNVSFTPPNISPDIKTRPLRVDEKGMWSNYGFQEVKVLDGNIGYLKVSHFTKWEHFDEAKKVVTKSFNFLSNTDALIIDVRNNGGGFEAIVAYVISYLFDEEPIHLSDYYERHNNARYGIWTTKDIPGKKMPNVPVYVLVNDRTGSAAESLAYMLKHLDRAIIIGEVTRGAGNGAMKHKLSERFSVTIASEETINTITKTSFEQVGVIPNIKSSSDNSFSVAYKLALDYLAKNNFKNVHPSNYSNIKNFIPQEKVSNDTDIESYEKYVGTYKSLSIEIKIFLNGKTLFAQMKGNGSKFKLIPNGDNTFIVADIKERVEFVMNNNNEVVKLIGIDSPMDLNKVK